MASPWRASEDTQLARLYAQNVPLAVIAERLGRSAEALTARRKQLGIASRRRIPTWTEQQDHLIILATRAGVPASDVARQQGRSPEQVRARRAHLLGARSTARRYEPWEDAAITAAWAEGLDVRVLAVRLGRSADALRLRARSLGLHDPPPRRRWSSAEDHALREGYSIGLSCREIQRRGLPHRSPGAISARAGKLGLTSYARLWSEEDDRRLALLLAERTPVDQVALALTRTPEAIRQRMRRLSICAGAESRYLRSGERWSDAEDAVLRADPGAHPSVLGKLLSRSDHSIRRRQRVLGIRTASRSPHNAGIDPGGFSPAEDGLVLREIPAGERARATRLLALSARLARTPGELQRRAAQLRRLRGRTRANIPA
ncbi:MAG: hypothetical protein ACYC91_09420 [Solirubrobacteraceae bacterium]